MTEEEQNIENSKRTKQIFIRYIIVVVLMLPIVTGILFRSFETAIIDRDKWVELGKSQEKPSRLIQPNRGNMYSSDGKLMVTSSPRYELYIDFLAGSFMKDTFLLSVNNGVDSLAFYLSQKLKDRSAAGYKTHLMRGLNEKKRNYRIYSGRVSVADLVEIRKFPFFRLGNSNRTGLKADEKMQRVKLFGSLASRTFGDITIVRDRQGRDSRLLRSTSKVVMPKVPKILEKRFKV